MIRKDHPAGDRPDAVLDTNVVLDWLVFRDPVVEGLAHDIEQARVRWLVTPSMQAELRRVLDYDDLVRRGAEAGGVLTVAARHWHVVDEPAGGAPLHLRCSDPDDQMFIDLALARQVPWLVTRDKALLKLAARARQLGTTVMKPHRWPRAACASDAPACQGSPEPIA